MNKFNLIKKYILSALVIFYDIVSLFWCYIIICNFIFAFFSVSADEHSIAIIGGADIPTLIFIAGNVLRCVLAILFVPLNIATVVFSTVSTFKKQTNQKSQILLCVLVTLSLIVYMLIPLQSLLVPFFILFSQISFLKHLSIFYIILSLVIVARNVSLVIKKGNEEG